MSEMVERVARALAKNADDSYEDQPSFWWAYARIAIEEMREPTVDMLVAAEEAAPELMSFAAREQSPSYLAHQAAIEAALKSEPRS